MKHGKTLVLCLGTVFVLLLSSLPLAGKEYTYAPDPGKEVYFGHISYTEIFDDALDPVVYRPGQNTPEIRMRAESLLDDWRFVGEEDDQKFAWIAAENRAGTRLSPDYA